jgi:hypothetical protein
LKRRLLVFEAEFWSSRSIAEEDQDSGREKSQGATDPRLDVHRRHDRRCRRRGRCAYRRCEQHIEPRVEVSSSNFPRFDRNLNTGEDQATGRIWQTARQTIFRDRRHPSHIVLPVILR